MKQVSYGYDTQFLPFYITYAIQYTCLLASQNINEQVFTMEQTHSSRCNTSPKQAIGMTDRGPDGDPQQALSTTTSGYSLSLLNHANRGMPHLRWSTRARAMHSPRRFKWDN